MPVSQRRRVPRTCSGWRSLSCLGAVIRTSTSATEPSRRSVPSTSSQTTGFGPGTATRDAQGVRA